MSLNKRLDLYLTRILLPSIFLFLFLISVSGSAQEVKEQGKEPEDKFSYLMENGARMVRESEFEKVLDLIRGLTPEKQVDFRIRVIENFAYLKGYLVTKKNEYGKKWEGDHKAIVYTGNKTATPILIDLLKDNDPYLRAFTARALGYLGDQTALEPIKKVAESDPNQKVRSRARKAYELISGEPLKE